MQAIAAVGDMRSSDVLRRGDEILEPNRQQGPKRNLKRAGSTTHSDLACYRVNVDRVPTDAHRIQEMRRARPALMVCRYFLFDNRLDRTDSSTFSDVGVLRESVRAAH